MVDVSETKDAVVVKAEIPGVEQKDITVSLQDQVLTIKGEKHREDEKYHRVERSWGAFTRSFRMPVAVAGDKVTATFKDGTLTVMLPKAAEAKGTMIPVKTG
jgi:HSP20 family protein